MLRKKLLLVLGTLVTLLLAAGVGAVLMLQSVLSDLNHVIDEEVIGTAAATAIQAHLSEIESGLERVALPGEAPGTLDFGGSVADMQVQVERLRALEMVDFAARERVEHIQSGVAALTSGLGAGSTEATLLRDTVAALQGDVLALRDALRLHAQTQERSVTSRFRTVALVLGLAFVLVLNASIMVLARMSTMILKPVDQLVEASRRLAREEFGFRIQLDRKDEFGELARAYNSLAAQLQANEARKIETLQQVARTLNHELNNAIAIIQLQLDLAARSAGPDGIQADRLREIQQALSRMASTVAALTRVRRIVLTDYLAGVKMLDLEASSTDAPLDAAPPERSTVQSSVP